MTETEATLKQYVARRGVTVEIVRDRGTQVEGDHGYVLALQLDGRTMETPWKQVIGIETSPTDTPAGVLDCLVMDAQTIFPDETEEEGFERWCGEFGYDTDSRSHWKTYQQIVAQTEALRAFLGDDYDHVLSLEGM